MELATDNLLPRQYVPGDHVTILGRTDKSWRIFCRVKGQISQGVPAIDLLGVENVEEGEGVAVYYPDGLGGRKKDRVGGRNGVEKEKAKNEVHVIRNENTPTLSSAQVARTLLPPTIFQSTLVTAIEWPVSVARLHVGEESK